MTVYFYKMTDDKRKLNKTLNENEKIVKNIVLLDVANINIMDCVLSSNISDEYNYCYIPSIKRYYFAQTTDILSNNRKRLHFETDYLMTYKNLIENSNLHFVKSSNPIGDKITFDTRNKISRKTYNLNNPFLDSYSDVLVSIKGV